VTTADGSGSDGIGGAPGRSLGESELRVHGPHNHATCAWITPLPAVLNSLGSTARRRAPSADSAASPEVRTSWSCMYGKFLGDLTLALRLWDRSAVSAASRPNFGRTGNRTRLTTQRLIGRSLIPAACSAWNPSGLFLVRALPWIVGKRSSCLAPPHELPGRISPPGRRLGLLDDSRAPLSTRLTGRLICDPGPLVPPLPCL
jgi:hypothetical protein